MMQWVCPWSLHISNIDKGQVTDTDPSLPFDSGRVMNAVIITGTLVAKPWLVVIMCSSVFQAELT